MIRHVGLSLLVLSGVMIPAAGPAIKRTFEGMSLDHLPADVVPVQIEPLSWFLRAVDGTTALSQELPADTERVAVLKGPLMGDLRLSGRLKGLSGRRVQGFVWRYQDQKNYFVVRSGGDDDEVEIPEIRVDLYFKGKRIPLGGNQKVAGLDVGQWHTLRVEHRGPVITAYLGDTKVKEIRDEHWCRLLPAEGAVGFFTKGSKAMFLGVEAAPLP